MIGHKFIDLLATRPTVWPVALMVLTVADRTGMREPSRAATDLAILSNLFFDQPERQLQHSRNFVWPRLRRIVDIMFKDLICSIMPDHFKYPLIYLFLHV